jgi:hypothetical protein
MSLLIDSPVLQAFMALKIMRDVPLSVGTRAFHFCNKTEHTADRQCYEEGINLEKSRFLRGSLAQEIFDRLSVVTVSRPAEAASKKK